MFRVTTALDGRRQRISATCSRIWVAQGSVGENAGCLQKVSSDSLRAPESLLTPWHHHPPAFLMPLTRLLRREKAFTTSKTSVIDSFTVIKGRLGRCSWNFRIKHKQHGKIITNRPGLHNFHIKHRGKLQFAQFSFVNVFLSDNQLIVQARDYNVGGTCNNHRADLLARKAGVYGSRRRTPTQTLDWREHRRNRQRHTDRRKIWKCASEMNKKFIFRWKTFLCSIEDGNKQLNLYLIQSFTRWHSCQMKEKFFRVPGEEKHTASSAADVFMVTEMKQKSESHSEAQSVVFVSNSSLIECGFLWCFEHSCVYAVPLSSSPNENKRIVAGGSRLSRRDFSFGCSENTRIT